VVVEELLELLITEVDADLLEAIVIEDFKTSDVEDTDELDPSHGRIHEGVVTFVTR